MSTLASSSQRTSRQRRAKQEPTKATAKRVAKIPIARRTTVTLSPRAVEIVERLREAAGLGMSEAISSLIEKSEPRKSRIVMKDGLAVLDVQLRGGKITTEDVKRMLESEAW